MIQIYNVRFSSRLLIDRKKNLLWLGREKREDVEREGKKKKIPI